MAYEKQNFEDGAVLKASHLNHIEDGIEAVENKVKELAERGGGKLYKHYVSINGTTNDDKDGVNIKLRLYRSTAAPLTITDFDDQRPYLCTGQCYENDGQYVYKHALELTFYNGYSYLTVGGFTLTGEFGSISMNFKLLSVSDIVTEV